MSLGVPREIVTEKKNEHSFSNLLAKINKSSEKYHSLLKRSLTIIIGLLYLQLTDHANVPSAVDIIIFMQGFPETWKLFQGFLQGKKIEKGWFREGNLLPLSFISLVLFNREACFKLQSFKQEEVCTVEQHGSSEGRVPVFNPRHKLVREFWWLE
jgi:hypothetical protein